VRHALPDGTEYEPIARNFREAWPRALQRLETYLDPTTVRVGR